MKTTTDGLTIWEVKTGEADRVITLLTPNGVVSAYAKNSLRPKNKLTSPTSMLAYSNYELYAGKNMFTVDDAHSITRFTRLAADVEGYSLAIYLCELTKLLAPVEDDATDFLSLLLNSLYLLNEKKRPLWLVKCVFELRAMCYAGYMPDLSGCSVCGETQQGGYFDVDNGVACCADCAASLARPVNCPAGTMQALRHIVEVPLKSAFSFTLTDEAKTALCSLCERYVQAHIDHRLGSLDFLKTILT